MAVRTHGRPPEITEIKLETYEGHELKLIFTRGYSLVKIQTGETTSTLRISQLVSFLNSFEP